MNNFASLTIIIALTLTLLVVSCNASFAEPSKLENIASNIFENKTLILPNSVKNFIILIPNEAHESPLLPKDQRLINQPYVPQNLVAPPATTVVWFSGDVGHAHKITLTDEHSKKIFSSVLKFNSATKPLSLNESGKFTYSEFNSNKDDPNFVMNGSIIVSAPEINSNNKQNLFESNFDTLSAIMIPTNDIGKHSIILNEYGINILDQYSFKDLRETTGRSNQTLLVLGSNESMDKTISVIKKITSSLPYT